MRVADAGEDAIFPAFRGLAHRHQLFVSAIPPARIGVEDDQAEGDPNARAQPGHRAVEEQDDRQAKLENDPDHRAHTARRAL